MTANEKAKELVNTYTNYAYTNVFSFRKESNWNNAKKCALICVDEILKTFPCIHGVTLYENQVEDVKYWQQVKQEIKNLQDETT